MQGFQMLLRAIGIDLSPDGIKEMFSKVTAEDIKRLVGELGLNADEVLAMPKIVATKLQEFEQRQIRILQLLEANNERYSGRAIESTPLITFTNPGTNRRSTDSASGGGSVSNGSDNG